MTTTLDALLADSAIPTRSDFDVAAGLRRLAADAAAGGPTPEVLRARQAAQGLGVVCRWVLNSRDAAAHVDHLAQNTPRDEQSGETIRILPDAERRMFEETFDIHGALVFACLLSLSDQPESAQFWWQLAAGAGNRIAAYCLHLHHQGLGELREAKHWYHQVLQAIQDAADEETTTEYLEVLNAMTRYVRRNGSRASAPPPSGLEVEVDRLAAQDPNGLVKGPDQQLADRLHEIASRR